MSKFKDLIAVAAISLAAASFNALAAGTFRCPELPAHSGIKWIRWELDRYPIVHVPAPNWCDAVDAKSGKFLFVVQFVQYPVGNANGGGQGRDDGASAVAGRRVVWRTAFMTYGSRLPSAPGPDRTWSATVGLSNGVGMKVTILVTRDAERKKVLDVLAHMRIPNQG